MSEDIARARQVGQALKPSRKWQPMKLSPGEGTTQGGEFWRNHIYAAGVDRFTEGWPFGGGPWAKLGICSIDGEARHDWRDFQRIKDDIVGAEWEALELFPAESRLMDPSNYYILWCAPKIPIGAYSGRVLRRPENAIAPQRGWHCTEVPFEAMRGG